jgi:addiction module RelE/StbE family toxin
MPVRFSKTFARQYDNALPPVQEIFKKRLRIFLQDKSDPILNNHPLKGKMKGCRSINVGGDWRAIFEESPGGDIFFLLLGTHSQLYK